MLCPPFLDGGAETGEESNKTATKFHFLQGFARREHCWGGVKFATPHPAEQQRPSGPTTQGPGAHTGSARGTIWGIIIAPEYKPAAGRAAVGKHRRAAADPGAPDGGRYQARAGQAAGVRHRAAAVGGSA